MSIVYVVCTLALGPLHLDDLRHAAAGDDDRHVLLPDADDLPLGLHLSDREHAPCHSAGHVCDPAAAISWSSCAGIFLKGIGLKLLWPQAVALASWGTAVLMLAVVRSPKRAS